MEFRTNGNKATIGITVLGAISAFSVWSACNPSLFTVAQFTTEQSKKNARFGMKVGVVLNALLGAGIYLAYGRKGMFPAVLTTATGVGLYFLYEHMLNKVNISNPSGQDMNQQHMGFQFDERGGSRGGGRQDWGTGDFSMNPYWQQGQGQGFKNSSQPVWGDPGVAVQGAIRYEGSYLKNQTSHPWNIGKDPGGHGDVGPFTEMP